MPAVVCFAEKVLLPTRAPLVYRYERRMQAKDKKPKGIRQCKKLGERGAGSIIEKTVRSEHVNQNSGKNRCPTYIFSDRSPAQIQPHRNPRKPECKKHLNLCGNIRAISTVELINNVGYEIRK